MSRRVSPRVQFGLVVAAAIVALAVWYLWTGSRWPALVGLVATWLFCLISWRGVFFWVFFVAASVLVVVWVLGDAGPGFGVIVLILVSVAIALGKPRRPTDASV